MMAIHVQKTADEKFLIESWVDPMRGKFVFGTIDEVITFMKEAFQVKEK